MNDWPPPNVPDAPLASAPSPAAPTAPWWRRRRAGVAMWGWATIGVIAVCAFAVIGNAIAPGRDGAATGDLQPLTTTVDTTTPESTTIASPTAPTAPTTTTPPTTTEAPTTVPRVQSAPPTPPTTEAAPAPTTEPGPTTTIVVTLPPTTIAATTPPVAPPIEIDIRFDADGDDDGNRNDEWVRFTNAGTRPVDMTNWIVRDDGLAHAHVFDVLVLEPGAAVTLYSGCGEATASERYFCTSGSEVWNNDGDVVSLFDVAGDLVARRIG